MALLGAADKLNEYYKKMADSNAHILTMHMSDVDSTVVFTIADILLYHIVLHPEHKMAHFKKHWDTSLQQEVLELGQNAVCCSQQVIGFY